MCNSNKHGRQTRQYSHVWKINYYIQTDFMLTDKICQIPHTFASYSFKQWWNKHSVFILSILLFPSFTADRTIRYKKTNDLHDSQESRDVNVACLYKGIKPLLLYLQAFILDILTLEYETTMLSWNIENQLPSDVVSHPRRTDTYKTFVKILLSCM
jgi:hypothetical protein